MTTILPTIEISDLTALPFKPLVSISMLAYRHEKFIAQAIEGVVTQQCDFPIELIIGEDCSPDRTREIVLDYQRRYPNIIRVLTAEKNVGMHANGDRCGAACRGEFIANCEGDDYWHHPRKLQMQIDAMKSDSNITLCHTDYDRLIGSQLIRYCHQRSKTPYLAVGDAYEKLLHHLTVMTATSVYRKNIVQAFGSSEFANPNWPFGDYNLALFAAVSGKIAYVAESTATWRKVRGSAMNSGTQAHLNARIATMECREAFMRRYPVADYVKREALCFANRNIMNAALHACRKADFQAARGQIIKLGGTLPPIDDFLRCTAIKFLFLAKAYQIVRSKWLKITTDQL